MHSSEGLSSTHEMYLKVLYQLEEENEVARVRDMARGLGVKPGTITAVLKKLEQNGLVIHDHYGAIKLTPAGKRLAVCVVHRFEILKQMLTNVLGLDEDEAELDACQMEHAVSPNTINRMEVLLQRVKDGQVNVGSMLQPVLDHDPTQCSDCAESGICQAVASMDVENN